MKLSKEILSLATSTMAVLVRNELRKGMIDFSQPVELLAPNIVVEVNNPVNEISKLDESDKWRSVAFIPSETNDLFQDNLLCAATALTYDIIEQCKGGSVQFKNLEKFSSDGVLKEFEGVIIHAQQGLNLHPDLLEFSVGYRKQ